MPNREASKLKVTGSGEVFNVKDIKARSDIGDLSELETEDKSSLVDAINEVRNGGGGSGTGLPDGGYRGQVLTKESNTDGDADWEDLYITMFADGPLSSLTVTWSGYTAFELIYYAQRLKLDVFGEHFDCYSAMILPGAGCEFKFHGVNNITSSSVTVVNCVVTTNSTSATSGSCVYSENTIGVSEQAIQDAVDDYLDAHPALTGMFTNEAKNALLTLLEKVAYIDSNGQTYLDNLRQLLAATVSSISAVFTQGANVVYTNDNLDSLKSMLVVTATYSDTTTAVIDAAAYSLSGVLSEGTSTVTVTYGGKTTTFTVNCTVDGFLYHFTQSIASNGSKDFGFSGPENFAVGYDGTGYSYCHLVSTDGDSSTDQGSIKSTSLVDTPDLSGDFTIAGWCKCEFASTLSFAIISNIKYNTTASTSNVTNAISSVQNLATGWTFSAGDNMSARYKGVRLQSLSGAVAFDIWATDNSNRASVRLTPPNTFDINAWHHYAATRKDGTVRIFVDGELICRYTYSKEVYFNTQVTTAVGFKADASTPSDLVVYAHTMCVDDLFVADYCKWDASFNASAILY